MKDREIVIGMVLDENTGTIREFIVIECDARMQERMRTDPACPYPEPFKLGWYYAWKDSAQYPVGPFPTQDAAVASLLASVAPDNMGAMVDALIDATRKPQ